MPKHIIDKDETNKNIGRGRPWIKRSFNDLAPSWCIDHLFADRNLEIGAPYGRCDLMEYILSRD